MAQLSMVKNRTPAELVIRVTQDPYDEADPLHLSAVIHSATGSQLAAGSIDLDGMEQDLLASTIEAITEVYRWGAGAQQLMSTMRYWQRKARAHRRLHER